MTDQQKLIVLLTEWGVEFDISARLSHINPKYGSGISITCRTGKGKIDGYGGFCTIFEFDEDEKFIEMGVWEWVVLLQIKIIK